MTRRYGDQAYGQAAEVAPAVLRIIAPNPKPFTYRGTNSYVVGDDPVVIIDPGPALTRHADAVMQAVDGRQVAAILVTHSHIDHSGGAFALRARTGAPVFGFGALPAMPQSDAIEADYDFAFAPTHQLQDRARLTFNGLGIEAIHTPGHFPNHLCFRLAGGDLIFSGDHVMGWSSTVIAPPIGDMAQYMASLDKLLAHGARWLLPGHGPRIANPHKAIKALIAHRIEREGQVLDCLKQGLSRADDIARAIYDPLEPILFAAACKSVEAHKLHLIAQGLWREPKKTCSETLA
ncbi:MAG: MBL fold metallo-hydrolase [Pseudomonadota bacterium]|jgi:glyoxylase-like metal-dependent hydrolase (beta-lactamase superfamily II)